MNLLVKERRNELETLCRRYGVLRLDLFGYELDAKEHDSRARRSGW